MFAVFTVFAWAVFGGKMKAATSSRLRPTRRSASHLATPSPVLLPKHSDPEARCVSCTLRLMQPFDYQPRTRIVFGPGRIEALGELASELGARRAVVVSD